MTAMSQVATGAARQTSLVPVRTTLPIEQATLAVRAALEGVPIRAIARIFRLEYEHVVNLLGRAVRLGQLVDLPKSDWSVAGSSGAIPAHSTPHLPVSRSASIPCALADLEFLCRETFKLSNLEAGFLAVLLRCLFAEKDKLHAVVEKQRYQRPLRPITPEVTDIKIVDVIICKLRRKLKNAHPTLIIRTSWGKGYFLDTATKQMVLSRLAPQ